MTKKHRKLRTKKYRGGVSDKDKAILRAKYIPPDGTTTIRELMQFVRDNKIKYKWAREITDYLEEIGSPVKPLPEILKSVRMEERTTEVCLEAIRINEREIFNIPKHLQQANFYLKAAKVNGLTLEFIPHEITNYKKVCLAAIKQNGEAIRYLVEGTEMTGEYFAYAKYSDNPFDFVGYSDEKGYLERINKAVVDFLEPLAQKYETRQGFLESQQQLPGLQKHGYHHKMKFLKLVQGFADIDVEIDQVEIDPDILMRYRKEYPREFKGPWVGQVIDRTKEAVFGSRAAERDAASAESKSAIAEEAARNKFIPLVRPEKPKESPSTSPQVFPLIDVDAKSFEAAKRIERAEKERLEKIWKSKAYAESERTATELNPLQSRFEADKERAEKIRISKAEAELERAATEPQPQSRFEEDKERLEKERLEKIWKSQDDAELERAKKKRAEQERLEKIRISQEDAESEKTATELEILKDRSGGKTRKKRKTRRR